MRPGKAVVYSRATPCGWPARWLAHAPWDWPARWLAHAPWEWPARWLAHAPWDWPGRPGIGYHTEFCVMAYSRIPLIPGLERIESFGKGSFYTKHAMASGIALTTDSYHYTQ